MKRCDLFLQHLLSLFQVLGDADVAEAMNLKDSAALRDRNCFGTARIC